MDVFIVVGVIAVAIAIAVAVYVRRDNRRKPAPGPKPSDYPAPPAPSPEAVAEAVTANKDAIDKAIELTTPDPVVAVVPRRKKATGAPRSAPKNMKKV